MGYAAPPPLQDAGAAVAASVFYGRRRLFRIMHVYLERNLRRRGGVLDGVLLVPNTDSTAGRFYAALLQGWRGRRTLWLKLDDDITPFRLASPPVVADAAIGGGAPAFACANVVNHPRLTPVHARLGLVREWALTPVHARLGLVREWALTPVHARLGLVREWALTPVHARLVLVREWALTPVHARLGLVREWALTPVHARLGLVREWALTPVHARLGLVREWALTPVHARLGLVREWALTPRRRGSPYSAVPAGGGSFLADLEQGAAGRWATLGTGPEDGNETWRRWSINALPPPTHTADDELTISATLPAQLRSPSPAQEGGNAGLGAKKGQNTVGSWHEGGLAANVGDALLDRYWAHARRVADDAAPLLVPRARTARRLHDGPHCQCAHAVRVGCRAVVMAARGLRPHIRRPSPLIRRRSVGDVVVNACTVLQSLLHSKKIQFEGPSPLSEQLVEQTLNLARRDPAPTAAVTLLAQLIQQRLLCGDELARRDVGRLLVALLKSKHEDQGGPADAILFSDTSVAAARGVTYLCSPSIIDGPGASCGGDGPTLHRCPIVRQLLGVVQGTLDGTELRPASVMCAGLAALAGHEQGRD
eukprot:gene33853-17841_t